MNRTVLVVVKGLLLAFSAIGCRPITSSSQRTVVVARALWPIVSSTELKSLVQQSDRPLLVEFGVNDGCFRCDRMKPAIARLVQRFEGRADVVRVDFNANRQSAAQYGATICPSYIVFNRKTIVSTRSFPTSTDLVAIDLESVMAREGGGL
ncbi:MAG: hypothetical protein CMJ75_20585 [Planctomycetaceae bacterium]|nr:hypothetical protein [Planctomycetaceae bacterium]